MARAIIKRASDSDEHRPFVAHGGSDVLKLGELTVGRAVFEPGWRWSKDVKPLAGTEFCEVVHTTCILSGRIHVKMRDGQEFELGPGDVAFIPPGHDGWVVGDEPCHAVDFTGAEDYARARAGKEEEARPSLQ
ncbi:cupin domain-containing protein [Myxococcaceae bacterium JPH2]|nr:cupin domain-containing protein [Myxococcaceae bacterium JPH2]